MPTPLDKVLYTAHAHTTGGRDGASRTDDGRLDVKLSSPGTSGTGTNPEQLFAAGYSACFIGAMKAVAARTKTALPADLAIDAVSPGGFGAVVVVGGPGTPAYLWPNKHLHQIVKSINGRGGVVAAICLAPVVLARAGVIGGRRCTVFPTADSLREMTDAGCLLQKEHLVVDGNIVTADGPGVARAFGEAIVRLLRAAQ